MIPLLSHKWLIDIAFNVSVYCFSCNRCSYQWAALFEKFDHNMAHAKVHVGCSNEFRLFEVLGLATKHFVQELLIMRYTTSNYFLWRCRLSHVLLVRVKCNSSMESIQGTQKISLISAACKLDILCASKNNVNAKEHKNKEWTENWKRRNK